MYKSCLEHLIGRWKRTNLSKGDAVAVMESFRKSNNLFVDAFVEKVDGRSK